MGLRISTFKEHIESIYTFPISCVLSHKIPDTYILILQDAFSFIRYRKRNNETCISSSLCGSPLVPSHTQSLASHLTLKGRRCSLANRKSYSVWTKEGGRQLNSEYEVRSDRIQLHMLASHHKWPRLLLKCISDKLESDLDSTFHYLTSLGILGLNLFADLGRCVQKGVAHVGYSISWGSSLMKPQSFGMPLFFFFLKQFMHSVIHSTDTHFLQYIMHSEFCPYLRSLGFIWGYEEHI